MKSTIESPAVAALALWHASRRAYDCYVMQCLKQVTEETLQLLSHPAAAAPAAELRGLVAHLTPEFQVFVMGTFNAGKSTFINALLGRELMPAKATRCTRLLVLLRDGPGSAQHCASTTRPRGLSLDNALAEIARSVDDKGKRQDWYELSLPAPDLRGFQLADVPGFNDRESLDHRHCQTLLPRADAIVWLMLPTKVGSNVDRQLLKMIPAMTPKLVVLTRRDTLKESPEGPLRAASNWLETWERERAAPAEPASAAAAERRVLMVDSKAALEARLLGDEPGWQASGVPEVLAAVKSMVRLKHPAKYQQVVSRWDDAAGRMDKRRAEVAERLRHRETAQTELLALAGRELFRIVKSFVAMCRERLFAAVARLEDGRAGLLETREEPGFDDRVWDLLTEQPLPPPDPEEARVLLSEAKAYLDLTTARHLHRLVQPRAKKATSAALFERLREAATPDNHTSECKDALPASKIAAVHFAPDRGSDDFGLATAKLTRQRLLQDVKIDWSSHVANWWQGAKRLWNDLFRAHETQFDQEVVNRIRCNLTREAEPRVTHFAAAAAHELCGHLEHLLVLVDSHYYSDWQGDEAAARRELSELERQLKHLEQRRNDLLARLNLRACLAALDGRGE